MQQLSKRSKEYSVNQNISLRKRSIARAKRAALMVALAALFLAPIFPLAQPAHAAGSISVDILDDNGMFEDDMCSLREAIQAANTDEAVNDAVGSADCPAGNGADVITFDVAGTITLEDEININSDISIQGPIILSGGGETRIFRIGSSDGVLSLSSLTIEDGFSSGSGGAIWNQYGVLNIIGSSFQNNAADGNGGAINSNSELNILMSTFAGNQAGDTQAKSGGAIHMSGAAPIQLSLSNFGGNIATAEGGAIAITSPHTEVEISDTIFSGNIALGDDPASNGGGAIYNESDLLQIIRSAFNGNLCPEGGGGGALYNKTNAAAVISDSSFNGNISGGLSDGLGGAIYNAEDLSIDSCAFNGNISSASGKGGAIYNDKVGVATIANSSFFSNNAGGEGGAICNVDTSNSTSDSTVSLFNTTLSNNHAVSGGAIYNEESILLYNTIIDEGIGTGGTCAGAGTITGDSHNLQNPGVDCGASIPSADPLLELPNFNGGPIVSLLTQALEPGSPARDAGDDSVCAAPPVNNKDQRGEPRPLDGDGDGNAVCDIGAFEADEVSAGYGSNPVQPGPIQFGSAITSTTINASFEVFETGNMALSVGSLTLSGPDAADFNVVTAPFDIADGGSSVAVELDCTPSELGDRNATLTLTTNDADNLSVSYQLLCAGIETPQAGYGSTPPAPGPVDFASVIVQESKPIDFDIFETGTADLTVQSPELTGANPDEFTVVTAFPFTIVDGGLVQEVNLSCTPTESGIRTAILSLTTNDPDQPSVSYNLTCNGYVLPDPPLEPQPPTVGVFTPYDVAVSPDGNYAYVSSHFTHDLRVFTRTVSSGALEYTQSYDTSTPQGVEISPDGKHVFVTDAAVDKLIILERNSSDGAVSFFQEIQEGDMVEGSGNPPILFPLDGLEGADGLAVSPDGQNIYVAGYGDDTLLVFGRTVPTGTVKYMQLFDDATSFVTGLSGVRDVTVSPDGNHVYAASYNTSAGNPGAVTLFSRDPTNGRLTFVEAYTASEELKLAGAAAVAVSPDGAQVYVAAGVDESLLIFNRDPASGALTFFQRPISRATVNGLYGANGVTTNPDGSQIYVSSRHDDALVVFTRDFSTGYLSWAHVYRDEIDGVDGLNGASKVAVSPRGEHVYVTGYDDNEVAVFSVAKPTPILLRLDPASVVEGSDTFTLTLYGEQFSPDSVVLLDSVSAPTTYVSSNELEAVVDAIDIMSAQTTLVNVFTPQPGGGTSNTLNFMVLEQDDNPIPTLNSLAPSGAVAGDPEFTLLLNGANFVEGATVQWNGSERDTTFISATQLQALILASDLAAPGPAGVTVVNPTPGGGSSNALAFSVEEPGQNPVPSIVGLSPASVYATGAAGTDLVVYVTGANFIPASQVYLDGDPRVTSFVDGSQLEVTLTAGDTAFVGASSVTVDNPGPDGGTSNAVTFDVIEADGNLLPSIGGASLDSSTVGGVAYTLELEGAGFIPDSVIHWNGIAQATTFVSDTQLTSLVTLAQVFSSSGASVTVVNPAPGGGTSNTVFVAFYRVYLPMIIR